MKEYNLEQNELNQPGKNEAVEANAAEVIEQLEMDSSCRAASEALEAHEQLEMDEGAGARREADEEREQREMDEGASRGGESIGYSSSYYESMYANALKEGNKIASENAKRNWAKAKAKEDLED